MKTAIFVFITVGFLSCDKNPEEIATPYSEASYKVIISLNWQSPLFGVPENAHITGIIGMVHNKDTSLWMPGSIATPGLEDVAEIGNNTKMDAQLDAILSKNKALSKFTISPPPVDGLAETAMVFNTNYPAISFASMLAPSPDWFLGIHDFSLLKDGSWLPDVTLNLLVYDAGTEEGDVFAYNNPASVPQQNIDVLSPANGSVLAGGNSTIAPIGTVRFIKNQD